MIPNPFDYHAPRTLQKALNLLQTYGDDAKVLAGGHSLIPLMKLRFASPTVVIDISRVPGLHRLTAGKEQITIGALTTHYAIESSRRLKLKCPLLNETASEIGDAQVRNLGTIGGSLVHADPSADWPATVLALNAELEFANSNRRRTLLASDFFLDLLTTAIQPNEILTQIRIPTPPIRSGGAYKKMAQSASGFAIVGVAVQVTFDENGLCASVAVGITGISPIPYRASSVEDALIGQRPSSSVIQEASEFATNGLDQNDLQSDHHASSNYRIHLAKIFTHRALTEAVQRAS